MIKSLRLVNVQGHANLKLEFCPFTNYIIGETGAGKSAIARALRWVLFNKPVTTKHLLKLRTKKTAVEVVIDDHSILRLRTKSKNLYKLDGQVLKGFNKDVPEKVQAIIDMDEKLHVQKQADPYFLIGSMSAPECARALEKFTDLSIISRSVQKARADVLTRQRAVQTLTEEARELESKEKALAPVDTLNDDITLCLQKAKKLKKRMRLRGLLEQKRDILSANRAKVRRLDGICSVDLSEVAEMMKETALVVTLRDRLQGISARVASIDLQETSPVPPCPDMSEEFRCNRERIDRLAVLVKCRDSLGRILRDAVIAEKALNEVNELLRKIPVCKTCGKPI